MCACASPSPPSQKSFDCPPRGVCIIYRTCKFWNAKWEVSRSRGGGQRSPPVCPPKETWHFSWLRKCHHFQRYSTACVPSAVWNHLITSTCTHLKRYRLWGDVHPTSYGGSWRKMFILTPHLHFNGKKKKRSLLFILLTRLLLLFSSIISLGVYISKTSYVRPGERSLDNFYKPYHTVVYYRYLRFLPDGVLITFACVWHNIIVIMMGILFSHFLYANYIISPYCLSSFPGPIKWEGM